MYGGWIVPFRFCVFSRKKAATQKYEIPPGEKTKSITRKDEISTQKDKKKKKKKKTTCEKTLFQTLICRVSAWSLFVFSRQKAATQKDERTKRRQAKRRKYAMRKDTTRKMQKKIPSEKDPMREDAMLKDDRKCNLL